MKFGISTRVRYELVQSEGLHTKLLRSYLCIFPFGKITKKHRFI